VFGEEVSHAPVFECRFVEPIGTGVFAPFDSYFMAKHSAATTMQTGSVEVKMATGDFVQAWGQQTSGGALGITTNSWIRLVYLGVV
jgi:hypothetical protein